MHEVKDGSRTLQFNGRLLGESSSFRRGSTRWIEFKLYKTENGSYILSRIGVSIVFHSPTCSLVKRYGLKEGLVDELRDDSIPCEECNPAYNMPIVFPETDSVAVLKEYAKKNGVIDGKWNLVTGDKKQIYAMARKSYLAVKLGKPEELYDMVHTENFVLVDSKRRVRGFYDGTKKEDIERLIEDINFLCTQ